MKTDAPLTKQPSPPSQESFTFYAWVTWTTLGVATLLLLRSFDFMLSFRESSLLQITTGNFCPPKLYFTPDWLAFLIALFFMVSFTGIICYNKHPWKTLPLFLALLVMIALATPTLGLLGVYYCFPSNVMGLLVAFFGSWITSFFIHKDVLSTLRRLFPRETREPNA